MKLKKGKGITQVILLKEFGRKIGILSIFFFNSFLIFIFFLFIFWQRKGNKKESQAETKETERKTRGKKKEAEENYLSYSFEGTR